MSDSSMESAEYTASDLPGGSATGLEVFSEAERRDFERGRLAGLDEALRISLQDVALAENYQRKVGAHQVMLHLRDVREGTKIH